MRTAEGLGKKVRRHRTQRGWTQERLAQHAKVGVRTIQRLEATDFTSATTIASIAAALGVDMDALQSASHESLRLYEPQVRLLPQISKGSSLAALIGDCHAIQSDHDDLRDESEVQLLADFIQEVQDITDIWCVVELGDHVRFGFNLQSRVDALAAAGFTLFGIRLRRPFQFEGVGEPTQFDVAVIVIQRDDDARIMKSGGAQFLPTLC